MLEEGFIKKVTYPHSATVSKIVEKVYQGKSVGFHSECLKLLSQGLVQVENDTENIVCWKAVGFMTEMITLKCLAQEKAKGKGPKSPFVG